MIFRNDDISYKTDIQQLAAIHSLFVKWKITHTIAVICKDIELNQNLINYIRANNFDVQIHCWEHNDMSTSFIVSHDEIKKCIKKIEVYFGVTPTVLYPPWNKTSKKLDDAAGMNGIEVSANKISISQYLRGGKGNVINFHSWSDECVDLELALKRCHYANSRINS